MKIGIGILSAVALLTASTVNASPITLSLASSLLSATPGSTVTFTGTITETGGTPTFLNGDSLTTAVPLIPNDAPFFLNFPPVLNPLDSVTAAIFTLTVPNGTSNGLYSGSFQVLGGPTSSSLAILGSVDFAVNVGSSVPVPEPATGGLLLLGGAAVIRRRIRAG